VVALLSCVPILLSRATHPGILNDSDTKVLLLAIRERQNPWAWFLGDWPLENHFYRPVSTLFFELDNALYGSAAWGYGLTNALLAVGCTLTLMWFLRELTDRPLVSAASTALFALWTVRMPSLVMWVIGGLALAVIFAGIWRHGKSLGYWAPALLVLYFLTVELWPSANLQGLIVGWIPGRTASSMTLFLLGSLAAYARYERVSASRQAASPGPLDPPATKGTSRAAASKFPWLLPPLAAFLLALALGAYEQAVMGPALLLGTAVSFRIRGFRPRWGWQALFWGLLAAYLVFRAVYVPTEPSGYQLQQFRKGPGVMQDLAGYILPIAAWISPFMASLSIGLGALILSTFWSTLAFAAAHVVTFFESRRHWQLVLTGYALSVLAFLPMAWLKRFDHYHYLPLAFRALFVVMVGVVALELVARAVSPPTAHTPPRTEPAPGSLPAY
jgi:hypothetical protein